MPNDNRGKEQTHPTWLFPMPVYPDLLLVQEHLHFEEFYKVSRQDYRNGSLVSISKLMYARTYVHSVRWE